VIKGLRVTIIGTQHDYVDRAAAFARMAELCNASVMCQVDFVDLPIESTEDRLRRLWQEQADKASAAEAEVRLLTRKQKKRTAGGK
jgi:hypothetical protein